MGRRKTHVEKIETGCLIENQIVPDSDWILRDPDRWWEPGDFGTTPKADKVTMLVGHWTAGEAGGQRNSTRHGPRVYDVMKNRKSRKTGKPLKVSVPFVIGAPEDPDYDGFAPCWQFMDPGLVAGIHVGKRIINRKSIGVEVVSGGLPGRTDSRKRPQTEIELFGKERPALMFYPAQIRTWIRLANLLSSDSLDGGISIPKIVAADSDGHPRTSSRFSVKEVKAFEGSAEHWQMPGTRKVDAGGMLNEALAGAGWELVA